MEQVTKNFSANTRNLSQILETSQQVIKLGTSQQVIRDP